MRQREFKPWMRWTLLVVAFVATLAMTWRHVDVKAARELEAAKSAFATQGFPTRVEEIIPPSVPEEENADALLREAWRIVSGSAVWENSKPTAVFRAIRDLELHAYPTDGGQPRLNEDARAMLSTLMLAPEVTAFVDQIDLATQRADWRKSLDYSLGPMLLLEYLEPARTMVQLLAKCATAQAQHPALTDRGWEILRMIVVLSEWLGEEPMLIAYLSTVAGHGIARATAIELLEVQGPPDDLEPTIAHLQQTLRASAQRFERAIHGERIAYLGWFEHHLVGQRDWLAGVINHAGGPRWLRWGDPWLTPVLSPIARPRLAAELRECHALHLDVALALRADGPAMLPLLQSVNARAAASTWVLPQIVFPNFESLARTHLVRCTQQRAFIAVLAAFHHRQQTGVWPGSLTELGLPADGLSDACSTEPLVLRIEDTAISVYGFGFDGDDDGGRAAERPSDAGSDGDVVVRVRLRP